MKFLSLLFFIINILAANLFAQTATVSEPQKNWEKLWDEYLGEMAKMSAPFRALSAKEALGFFVDNLETKQFLRMAHRVAVGEQIEKLDYLVMKETPGPNFEYFALFQKYLKGKEIIGEGSTVDIYNSGGSVGRLIRSDEFYETTWKDLLRAYEAKVLGRLTTDYMDQIEFVRGDLATNNIKILFLNLKTPEDWQLYWLKKEIARIKTFVKDIEESKKRAVEKILTIEKTSDCPQ